MAKIWRRNLLALVLLVLWQGKLSVTESACKTSSPCLFHCGSDMMLDLTPLTRKDNKPVFTNVMDSLGQNMFSFSPCSSFTEGSGCDDVSVCQVDTLNTSSTIGVGDTRSVTLTEDGQKAPFLTYTQKWKGDGVDRTTIVSLECDTAENSGQPGSLSVHGETEELSKKYTMTLRSQYACLRAENGTSPAPPATTAHTNVTTEPPTTQHVNITTEPHTKPHANVTTEPLTTPHVNATTEPQTTHHSNATTEPQTTHHSNATTEPRTTHHSNVTTEPLTTPHGNGTTAGVTTEPVTNGTVTTHPSPPNTSPSAAITTRPTVLLTTVAMTVGAVMGLGWR